jgi:hypothetical protein
MNASVRMNDLASATALKAAAGKERKEVASTIEEMAAVSFDAGDWDPPVDGAAWQVKLTESVPTLMLAFAALRRSKPELMAITDKMGGEIERDFIENIEAWQGYFEWLATMLKTAEVRLMVAMAANIVKSEKKKRCRRK